MTISRVVFFFKLRMARVRERKLLVDKGGQRMANLVEADRLW